MFVAMTYEVLLLPPQFELWMNGKYLTILVLVLYLVAFSVHISIVV